MRQIEFFEIKNPCIGVCENGPRGYCKGCFRSREERQQWNQLESDAKRAVAQKCSQRKQRALAKKTTADSGQGLPPQDDLF